MSAPRGWRALSGRRRCGPLAADGRPRRAPSRAPDHTKSPADAGLLLVTASGRASLKVPKPSMRCRLLDSLLGQPVREGRLATEQEAGKLRAVRAKEPLARSFARKDKPPPVGRPVRCAPGDRLSGTGNMSRFASVQRRRPTSPALRPSSSTRRRSRAPSGETSAWNSKTPSSRPPYEEPSRRNARRMSQGRVHRSTERVVFSFDHAGDEPAPPWAHVDDLDGEVGLAGVLEQGSQG